MPEPGETPGRTGRKRSLLPPPADVMLGPAPKVPENPRFSASGRLVGHYVMPSFFSNGRKPAQMDGPKIEIEAEQPIEDTKPPASRKKRPVPARPPVTPAKATKAGGLKKSPDAPPSRMVTLHLPKKLLLSLGMTGIGTSGVKNLTKRPGSLSKSLGLLSPESPSFDVSRESSVSDPDPVVPCPATPPPRVALAYETGIELTHSYTAFEAERHMNYFDSRVEFTLQLPNATEDYSAFYPFRDDEDYAPLIELDRIGEMLRALVCNSNGRAELEACSTKVRTSIFDKDPIGFKANVLELNAAILKWRSDMFVDLPLPTAMMYELLNMTYIRVVSPQAKRLRRYKAFSNEVYGELMPGFMSRLFQETNLQKDQVFVDLGSGVGNCVLQAALEIGCESWGCEIMPLPAGLANEQKKEIENRTKAWGVPCGEINVISGNFVTDDTIHAAIKRANVVLANNFMFDGKLNSALLNLFLDLPDGAKIVSLKPFVSPRYQINASNANSAVSILKSETRQFGPDSVNWAPTGGTYYIATVDRRPLREFLENASVRQTGARRLRR